MALITGTDSNDLLFSNPEDDTIDGGLGVDIVSYESANSTDGITGVTVDLNIAGPQPIGADQGNDGLVSIEGVLGSSFNDTLTGDDGSNILAGMHGSDTLQGNGGDDFLFGDDIFTGANGPDTFKYTFSATQQGTSESFTGWLAAQGLSLDGARQGFFSSKYTEYLQYLVEKYDLGEDLNGDGKVKIKINQNDPDGVPSIEGLSEEEAAEMFGDPTGITFTTGHHHHHGHDHGHGHKHGHSKHQHTQERWFSDSFTMDGGGEATITSADGHDLIGDFTWGVDTLDFSGLGAMTQSEFEAAFSVTQQDKNGDGAMDTVIALEGDDTWSVALLGVSGHTEAELYGQITFA